MSKQSSPLTNKEYVEFFNQITSEFMKDHGTIKFDILKAYDIFDKDFNIQTNKDELTRTGKIFNELKNKINVFYDNYETNYKYNAKGKPHVQNALDIELFENVKTYFTKNFVDPYHEIFDLIAQNDANIRHYLLTVCGVKSLCMLKSVYLSLLENLEIHIPKIMEYITANTKSDSITKTFDTKDGILNTFKQYKRNLLIKEDHAYVDFTDDVIYEQKIIQIPKLKPISDKYEFSNNTIKTQYVGQLTRYQNILRQLKILSSFDLITTVFTDNGVKTLEFYNEIQKYYNELVNKGKSKDAKCTLEFDSKNKNKDLFEESLLTITEVYHDISYLGEISTLGDFNLIDFSITDTSKTGKENIDKIKNLKTIIKTQYDKISNEINFYTDLSKKSYKGETAIDLKLYNTKKSNNFLDYVINIFNTVSYSLWYFNQLISGFLKIKKKLKDIDTRGINIEDLTFVYNFIIKRFLQIINIYSIFNFFFTDNTESVLFGGEIKHILIFVKYYKEYYYNVGNKLYSPDDINKIGDKIKAVSEDLRQNKKEEYADCLYKITAGNGNRQEQGAYHILNIFLFNNHIINVYVELFDFFNKGLEIKKKFDKITLNFKGFTKKKDITQIYPFTPIKDLVLLETDKFLIKSSDENAKKEGLVIIKNINGTKTYIVKPVTKSKSSKIRTTDEVFINLCKMIVDKIDIVLNSTDIDKLMGIDILQSEYQTTDEIDEIKKFIELEKTTVADIAKILGECQKYYDDYTENLTKINNLWKSCLQSLKTLEYIFSSVQTLNEKKYNLKNDILKIYDFRKLYYLRSQYKSLLIMIRTTMEFIKFIIPIGYNEGSKQFQNIEYTNIIKNLEFILKAGVLIVDYKFKIFNNREEVAGFIKDNYDVDTKLTGIEQEKLVIFKLYLSMFELKTRTISIIKNLLVKFVFKIQDPKKRAFQSVEINTKIDDLIKSINDKFTITEYKDKDKILFEEYMIDFARCFELINKDDLIKQMGDMRDILPFNKIENNHKVILEKFMKNIDEAKNFFEGVGNNTGFKNKIFTLKTRRSFEDVNLSFRGDKEIRITLYPEYIDNLKKYIGIIIDRNYFLLYNILQIKENYDQTKPQQQPFYKLIQVIFFKSLNMLKLIDYFFKYYLDMYFCNKIKVEYNILIKMCLENFFTIENDHKRLVYKSLTSDEIKAIQKISDSIGSTYSDDRGQLLNLGYYLERGGEEVKVMDKSKGYFGIINVVYMFDYYEKFYFNFFDSFDFFTTKKLNFNLFENYNEIRKKIQDKDAPIPDYEKQFDGIELIDVNKNIVLPSKIDIAQKPNIKPSPQATQQQFTAPPPPQQPQLPQYTVPPPQQSQVPQIQATQQQYTVPPPLPQQSPQEPPPNIVDKKEPIIPGIQTPNTVNDEVPMVSDTNSNANDPNNNAQQGSFLGKFWNVAAAAAGAAGSFISNLISPNSQQSPIVTQSTTVSPIPPPPINTAAEEVPIIDAVEPSPINTAADEVLIGNDEPSPINTADLKVPIGNDEPPPINTAADEVLIGNDEPQPTVKPPPVEQFQPPPPPPSTRAAQLQQQQAAQLQQLVTQLQQQVGQLQPQLPQQPQAILLQQEFGRLQQEVGRLQQEVRQLQPPAFGSQQQITLLYQQATQLQRQIGQLQQQVSQFQPPPPPPPAAHVPSPLSSQSPPPAAHVPSPPISSIAVSQNINNDAQSQSQDQSLNKQHIKTKINDSQNLNDDVLKSKLYYLQQRLGVLSQKLDNHKVSDNSQSYYIRTKNISDYRDFKTQTDREPQDFIAQIKLKNIGGKQNIDKYKYITEDSLGKVANNNKARELANKYNKLTDKMIETEKKIGGIQNQAIHDLSKSESGYIRMRGGEQQTTDYNNLIKQYQLMAIKQNNIINEIKNIKLHY